MAKSQSRKVRSVTQNPVFTALNYQLIVVGLVFIFVGFLAMYIENKYDGFVSLYIAPLLILFGFFEIVYAIMKVDKPSDAEDSKN